MIKSEKRKLRQAEINQFKLEQDVDRKFETGKIIKRHQQLEDQLHSKFILFDNRYREKKRYDGLLEIN